LGGTNVYPSVAIKDPSRLCPFCDEEWPEFPSEELLTLRKTVEKVATKQPRYDNAAGLKAPMQSYIDLCQLHRSETQYIPEGILNGWPQQIDWKKIPKRLRRADIERALQRITKHPYESKYFIFAFDNIKKYGSRVAESARCQLETFEYSQPG
jgi:hypothetical protein